MAAGGDEIPRMIDFLAARARLRPDAPPVEATPKISQDPWFDMLGSTKAASDSKPIFIWATDKTGRKVRVDGPFASELEAQRNLKEMYSTREGSNLNLSIGPME